MGDENPIRTLGDYSKPSHEGYKNTIELPVGNNVVPLRSDTIREGTHMRLFQFSSRRIKLAIGWNVFRAGSSPHGRILLPDSLLQFFPPEGDVKLCNDILMFQQRHGESLSKAWTRLSPQPQALETTFEARVRDYMAAHTERIERFENAIFKQHGGINSRMTEMFRLLKELMTSRTPEKVLIREEAKFPVTKNVNSISLTKGEEERSNKKEVIPDNTGKPTKTEMEMPVKEAEMKNGAENRAGNKSIKTT
ncbi:hypothetical protein Tco_0906732 [Tanacetum coccineum]|uniref:Uncharacterized protein n=1 Tax=Tanacetum coccineum TaxID=301880 RepID=A0ABQ5CJA7_9ASTR